MIPSKETGMENRKLVLYRETLAAVHLSDKETRGGVEGGQSFKHVDVDCETT